jgi:asparagine synthase (glutamine-hydrolysing)
MSGIVGIVSWRAPIDRVLLLRMTDTLAFRGPDRQDSWTDGPAGFGHTLLSTTIESRQEEQPASLDGRVWITADARVDNRADLMRRLAQRGRGSLGSATDAELILHAYHAWGEDCVEHLLGDFAFAIWDSSARRLFCARDHFGVKPFYYAEIEGGVVFSNTLDCVRVHPGVGDELNERAIGDFLLFGCNTEPTTTTFADVRRLAPAHTLTCGPDTLQRRQYWKLPADGRIRYRRSREYVDHFREVLRLAVSDRLRSNQVVVLMSGGLDSTAIAATARHLLSESNTPFDLSAQTVVYDSLIPDEERHYARMAAEALGIDIGYFVADDHRPLDGWDQPDLRMPEPTDDPFLCMRSQQLEQAASRSRVFLCGEGGDEVLWGSYVVDLVGRMRPLELAANLARCLVLHRLRPGAGIRSRLQKWRGQDPRPPAFPAWVNSAFAERTDLRARWAQGNTIGPAGAHRLRPEAYGRLVTAPWPWYFESFDPGVTRIPIEGRYPFLDLRVVNYLLAIPPLPWCVDKQLLRLAMHGALPDTIRLRPKAPLAGDPLRAHLRKADFELVAGCDPGPELRQWVTRAVGLHQAGGRVIGDPWLELRPRALEHWLRRQHPVVSLREEICHDSQVHELRRRSTGPQAVRTSAAGSLRRYS